MKRGLLLALSLMSVWLLAPSIGQAQTCEPRQNIPDYAAGSPAPIVCDLHGSQHVKILDSDGNVPDSSIATAATPSLNEGQVTTWSFDLSGNARVVLGTQLGGEHIGATEAEGYIRTRGDFLSSGKKTADAQIKATPGYVSALICAGTDATATAGSIILYDSLTETGTAVYTFDVLAADYHNVQVIPIQVDFTTGIYLGFTTTADMSCHVSYR